MTTEASFIRIFFNLHDCTFMLVALCQVSFVLFCNSSHCVKNVQIRPEKTRYVSMSQTFDKVPKDHKIGRKFFWFILSRAKSFYVLCFTCVWKKYAKFLYFSVVCPFLLHCFCYFCTSYCRPTRPGFVLVSLLLTLDIFHTLF